MKKVNANTVTGMLPGVPAADLKIEMWPIDRLIPYKKNARKWSGEAIAKVAASIRTFGFRQPLVADLKDVIVIGHLRFAAARYLGIEFVPVHVAADLTPTQIKALRIADNRTHEESSWDTKLLGVELIELKIAEMDGDFNLDVTGFEQDEIIENVFGAGKGKKGKVAPGGDADAEEIPRVNGIVIECSDEAQQVQLLEEFTERGLKCRALL